MITPTVKQPPSSASKTFISFMCAAARAVNTYRQSDVLQRRINKPQNQFPVYPSKVTAQQKPRQRFGCRSGDTALVARAPKAVTWS